MAVAKNGTAKGTPTEKFWHRTIEGWKTKSPDQRRRLEKVAQSYRSRHFGNSYEDGALAQDDETKVETNYFYAFADTLIAQVVPLNPAVTIKANRQRLDDAAKFRTMLVNTVFQKERMAQKCWAACTRATVWPRAWVKAVWSETRKRPILRVINPHYIWFDVNAEAYEDIRYIIEVSVLSKADFYKRIKRRRKGYYRADAEHDDSIQFGKWPKWLEPDAEWEGEPGVEERSELNIVRDGYEWTVVYELYDLRARKFYHFADGSEKPLMVSDLPYRHLPNPYMMVNFNDNLQDIGGMSDADLIYPMVSRKNEMDSLEMWHIKSAIPATVIHEGLCDDPDAFTDAFESVDGPGQAISLNAKAGVGIDQVLGKTPTTQLPIEWGPVGQRIEDNISFTLGLPSYARGELGQGDVATEMALADTAQRTRNARRQKVVYHLISECAQAIVALYQEFMPADERLPVRLMDGEKEEELTRELMEFGDGAEDAWAYDFEVHPYSAEEANSVVQMKQLTELLPILMQGIMSGHIDAWQFYKKLTELIKMPELLPDKPPPPPQQAAAAPPGGGGADPTQGIPDEMQAMVNGGEVMAGSGAQAVPGGMEGGHQPGGGGALGGMASFQQEV